jgi:hypothetical protein
MNGVCNRPLSAADQTALATALLDPALYGSDRFRRLTQTRATPFFILDFLADEDTVRSRLVERRQKNIDASEARPCGSAVSARYAGAAACQRAAVCAEDRYEHLAQRRRPSAAGSRLTSNRRPPLKE